MQDSSTPLFCSELPWARKRISPKIIDSVGKRSLIRQPGLSYRLQLTAAATGSVDHDTLKRILFLLLY
jgi:hypothetical protein